MKALFAGLIISLISLALMALPYGGGIAQVIGGIGLSVGLALSALAVLLWRWQGSAARAAAVPAGASRAEGGVESPQRRALAG